MTNNPIRVAVTGAAGQIGYSLLFRIVSGSMFGPDQPVILHLIEIEPALPALGGVVMELDDCAFPLLKGVVPTANLDEGFRGVNWALLVAVVFLILYARGTLPAAFAQSAGWGDIAVAATAPLVAWMVSRRPASIGGPVFLGWNVLGTLDLVIAVTLGTLSARGPLGILAGERSTEVMGMFPLSLIPTFAVPVLLIVHVILLGKAAQARATTSPRLGVAMAAYPLESAGGTDGVPPAAFNGATGTPGFQARTSAAPGLCE